jgi:hypothetical protein
MEEIKEEEDMPECEQYFTILKPLCFITLRDLESTAPVWMEMRGDDLEPNDIVMDLCLDFKELMDVDIETTIKDDIIAFEEDGKRATKRATKSSHSNIAKGDSEVIFEGNISQEEMSKFLSEKLTELFEGAPNANPKKVVVKKINQKELPKEEKKIRYKVVKKFKGSDVTTTLETFDKLEKAEGFIEGIREAYPDATENCDIYIVRYNAN